MWGNKIELQAFCAKALYASKWVASRSGHFNPAERALVTYSVRGWVDLRAGLDVFGNSRICLSFWIRITIPRYFISQTSHYTTEVTSRNYVGVPEKP